MARLGSGSTGDVWEAILHGPASFRMWVALKLLRSGPAGSAVRIDALAREARLGALLSHPNVVGTWELGEAEGRWFVAMEIVRGAPLSQLVESGPLPVLGNTSRLAGDLPGALAHLRAAEVVGKVGWPDVL